MNDFKDKFINLLSQDVSMYIEKRKNGYSELSYLSWTYAVQEMTKAFPEWTYKVKTFNNLPYIYDEKTGYMVWTSITANNITKEMWRSVMDGANRPMKSEEYKISTKDGKSIIVKSATMNDINNAIMRCLTKNIAMFGIGLYIYNGEDLPPKKEKEIIGVEEFVDKIKDARTKEELIKLNNENYKIKELNKDNPYIENVKNLITEARQKKEEELNK